MIKPNDNNIIFPDDIIKISEDKTYYGRLNDPSCSAICKGVCGDEMEYYLVIEKNIITDVKFHTTGCISSKACGITLAYFIFNKNIYEALKVSPGYILNELKKLSNDHHHCAILACITFYKAIGEYLVDNNS